MRVVADAERAGLGAPGPLTDAYARNLFKLMAYKDEYEVARLSLDPALDEQVVAQFGEQARYSYRLHPPVLRALGMKKKITLGSWVRPGFGLLYAGRRLRGTGLDVFGRTEVRRTERALPGDITRPSPAGCRACPRPPCRLSSPWPSCPTWCAATSASSWATSAATGTLCAAHSAR